MKSVFSGFRSTSDTNWFWALLSSTVGMYTVALVSIGLCYGYYTGAHVGQCKLHEFFITFNMILCVAMSVASVLPVVQEHQPNSGLLQVNLQAFLLDKVSVLSTPQKPR